MSCHNHDYDILSDILHTMSQSHLGLPFLIYGIDSIEGTKGKGTSWGQSCPRGQREKDKLGTEALSVWTCQSVSEGEIRQIKRQIVRRVSTIFDLNFEFRFDFHLVFDMPDMAFISRFGQAMPNTTNNFEQLSTELPQSRFRIINWN